MTYDRQVACIIPYRVRDGEVEVYMQKRSVDAERSPGKFGFFGGHLEHGETAEEAFKREMREELSIDISKFPYQWLGEFPVERDGEHVNKHIWFLKTNDDFESKIKIEEGESGHWFNQKDLVISGNRNHMVLNYPYGTRAKERFQLCGQLFEG